MPRGKTGQTKAKEQHKAVEVEQRQRAVFEAWADERLSYRELGARFNISHEQVRKDLHAVLEAEDKEFDDEVKAWKRKQLRRLDRMFTRFDARGTIEAGKLALAALKEINDVTGVKAAIKHDHKFDVSNLSDEELEAIAQSKG